MQAPPPTGTTGNAPRRVGPFGAGGVAAAGLEKALVAVAAGAGVLGSAPPTAAAHPTIVVIPTIRTNCQRIKVTCYRLRDRGRGRRSILRLAISGSRLVVRDSAGTSNTTDAPTVEADNAATRLRQRGKLGGNHRQGAATASKTAGILWGREHFAGQGARRRRIRCRCAWLRTPPAHQDKNGRGAAQSDSRPAFVHHNTQLYVHNVT